MQALTSHPEAQRGSSADRVADGASTTASSSRADVALVGAILAPLTIVGFMVLMGVDVAIAVCITFVLVVAVTTTLDVRWLVQCRRYNNDLRKARD